MIELISVRDFKNKKVQCSRRNLIDNNLEKLFRDAYQAIKIGKYRSYVLHTGIKGARS